MNIVKKQHSHAQLAQFESNAANYINMAQSEPDTNKSAQLLIKARYALIQGASMATTILGESTRAKIQVCP